VLEQRGLNLRGRQAVARHVDDVVDAAADPVVALMIAAGTVAGELPIVRIHGDHRRTARLT
jgi:hypothetical protein